MPFQREAKPNEAQAGCLLTTQCAVGPVCRAYRVRILTKKAREVGFQPAFGFDVVGIVTNCEGEEALGLGGEFVQNTNRPVLGLWGLGQFSLNPMCIEPLVFFVQVLRQDAGFNLIENPVQTRMGLLHLSQNTSEQNQFVRFNGTAL